MCDISIVYLTCLISMESKKDRFKRSAASRTNEVLYRLKVLGNCSNKQLYEFSEKDINRIFSEIEKKVKETKARFRLNKTDEKFEL